MGRMGSRPTFLGDGKGRGNAAVVYPVTFSACARRFLSTHEQKVTPSSMRRMRYVVSSLTQFFGAETPIQSIRRRDVQSFIRRRANSAAAATIALEFGVLTKILDVGVANEIISHNPANDVPRPQKVKHSPTSLTVTEFLQIQQSSPRWLRLISNFCLATSLTQALAIEARWSWLKKKQGFSVLEIAKGLNTWVIPLNRLAFGCSCKGATQPIEMWRPNFPRT